MPTAQIFLTHSLPICLFWLLLLISSLDGTKCPHTADECKFLLVGQYWSVHELEPITYKFVLTSSALPSMSCSSYLDGLYDRR